MMPPYLENLTKLHEPKEGWLITRRFSFLGLPRTLSITVYREVVVAVQHRVQPPLAHETLMQREIRYAHIASTVAGPMLEDQFNQFRQGWES